MNIDIRQWRASRVLDNCEGLQHCTAALKVEYLCFMFWFPTTVGSQRLSWEEKCSHWDEMREINKYYEGRSSTVPALTINGILQNDRPFYISELKAPEQLLNTVGTFDCSLSRCRDVWEVLTWQVPLNISLSACLDSPRQWSGPFITAAVTSWLFYCSISLIIVLAGPDINW